MLTLFSPELLFSVYYFMNLKINSHMFCGGGRVVVHVVGMTVCWISTTTP